MSQLPPRKPKLFIGSSREAISYANAVHSALSRVAQVLPWYNGTFKAGGYTMESLHTRVNVCDFAVFIFAADDVSKIRGNYVFTTRDNTLFEAGLFWGRLGRRRVFCLIPQEVEVSDGDHIKGERIDKYHLLSDLSGLNLLNYDYAHDGEFEAAVSVASNEIAAAIRAEGFFISAEARAAQLEAKVAKKTGLALLLWEYQKQVAEEITEMDPAKKYNALVEAIRTSFHPSSGRVTHVALYERHGDEGYQHVAGNMDRGQFYRFSPDNGEDPQIVIEVHNSQRWKGMHVQNVDADNILCYPLGRDHVISINIKSDAVLDNEHLTQIVESNDDLLSIIKQILGRRL